MRGAVNGGRPRPPPIYSLIGRSSGISYHSRLSSYRLSARLSCNHDVFTGKPRSSLGSVPSSAAWRRNPLRFSPGKNLLPGGCLRGKERPSPGFSRQAGTWPAACGRPFPWVVVLGWGSPGSLQLTSDLQLTSPSDVAGEPSSLNCTLVRHLLTSLVGHLPLIVHLSGVMGTSFPLR